MEPGLRHGAHVLIDPVRAPAVGDVVVACHPDATRSVVVIKRIAGIDGSGRLDLRSDHPTLGTDSRHFGPVRPDDVIGVVTLILATPKPR